MGSLYLINCYSNSCPIFICIVYFFQFPFTPAPMICQPASNGWMNECGMRHLQVFPHWTSRMKMERSLRFCWMVSHSVIVHTLINDFIRWNGFLMSHILLWPNFHAQFCQCVCVCLYSFNCFRIGSQFQSNQFIHPSADKCYENVELALISKKLLKLFHSDKIQ